MPTEFRTQKIVVPGEMTLKQMETEIEKGGRFVLFQYCISIFFAITLRRFSPAIFVKSGEDISKYRRKYNRISAIFGWWGIPWGPVYTIRSFKINKAGGLDITKDILANLDETALAKGEVEIKLIHSIFEQPESFDLKAFERSLKKDFETDPFFKSIYAGLYTNTEEGVEPYYIIGFESSHAFESAREEIKISLKKHFHKHVYFEFLDLKEETEWCVLLLEQGMRIV